MIEFAQLALRGRRIKEVQRDGFSFFFLVLSWLSAVEVAELVHDPRQHLALVPSPLVQMLGQRFPRIAARRQVLQLLLTGRAAFEMTR